MPPDRVIVYSVNSSRVIFSRSHLLKNYDQKRGRRRNGITSIEGGIMNAAIASAAVAGQQSVANIT
ncbi:hypothetical protein B2M20_16955 [Nitrobacter vulgaris]|uniref:Uncharacterized protein n=1 Tax=Nitrobacter vulgaris TaxID=29421 RepID=A0A1V4HUC5_NITVU|nr:hypothetical protein B2M20_16955 [Nitrobacter vulgaris]